MKRIVIITLAVMLAACSRQQSPPPTPEQAAQQAQEEVVKMTHFLQLCNTGDNGGIAKFTPAHTETYGRSYHNVAAHIECKNGLGAYYPAAQ